MKGRHLKVVETDLATPKRDLVRLEGIVKAELFGPDGDLKRVIETHNIITDIGDQYYGERASGIGSPPGQVTGAKLGTGTTAAAKNGAGAHIVTYLTGTQVAVAATFPQSSLVSLKRRIQWKFSWAAGVGTNSAISEAIITNQSSLANDAGLTANTLARTVFSPVIDKQAGDTLDVTWSHDIGTP